MQLPNSLPTGGSGFRTLQKLSSDYSSGFITKYESERTGMQVVVVDAKGPKVSGAFVLATEIHDDSGAPHTLEHLVFMGSKSYTYKGFLDRLATRAYAYTNAWTAVDNTGYQLETAGWGGFAQILPVYLEHILLPSLTDTACYTEVHHIDGSGHDAGVVYSEMQGVQNTASSLMDLKARRIIYPEGVGFRYETGGMMERLRELTADRIRDFHKEMYQPKNLCLIITGEVDQKNLLDVLGRFETEMAEHIPSPRPGWKRPWTDAQIPPLNTSVVERVEFPEEDESVGEMFIAFLGPSSNDKIPCTALDVLLTYLAGSSASVLTNVLIEKEQLASEVSYMTDERPNTLIWFTISGVATERLADVEKRFFELLKETASRPLDLGYLRECILRQKRQIKLSVESNPEVVQEDLTTEFLFGHLNGTGLAELTSLKRYDVIAAWEEKEWRDFLSKWIANAHHVSVLGVPSAKLSEKLKADEKARVDEQIAKIGPDGLRELEKKLAAAKAANEIDVPRELLEKFPIPSMDSIHFINTTTARSGLACQNVTLENPAQNIISNDTANVPLFIHFEDVETAFVHINLVISIEQVPVSMRPLLAIYMGSFFNLPVRRNGEIIKFDRVVTELERDTASYSMGSGEGVGNSEVLQVVLRVEPDKYHAAVQWLNQLLWDSVFDVERIQATVMKMLASIPEIKRDGDNMVSAVSGMVHFMSGSLSKAQNTLVATVYLKRLKALLRDRPETVISDLEEIRRALTRFENFRVGIIADLKKLDRPVATWKEFSDRAGSSDRLQALGSAAAHLSDAGKQPGQRAYLVPMAAIDSSYSLHTARGPDSPNHPQLPALLVAVDYLEVSEGPLWRAVRGSGLAYGTGFQKSVQSGLISYSIYSSPAASKAFAASKKVVEDLISGATPFETAALEGAVSKIVLGFASEEASMASAGRASFVNQVILGVPKDYKAQILRKVRAVTVDDLKAVLKDVILPIFQPQTSNMAVTCASVEAERVKEGFQKEGFNVEVRPLASFEDDYGLKAEGIAGADDDETSDDSGSSDDGSEGADDDDVDDIDSSANRGSRQKPSHVPGRGRSSSP